MSVMHSDQSISFNSIISSRIVRNKFAISPHGPMLLVVGYKLYAAVNLRRLINLCLCGFFQTPEQNSHSAA